MPQQIEQKNLEERIEGLRFEIGALEEELKGARKAKSDYLSELLNDRTAQERRLELLAAGHASGTICEFSQEQLAKLNNFTNIIRGIENGIVERSRAVEKLEKTIAAQQQLRAAETAILPKIEKFNQSLAQLQKAWEELQAVAIEHDVELEDQSLPGRGEIEERTQPGFENWLKIYFGD